ncbi:MAG: CARDB domain-containing protein [Planctomycetaceae bacterium]
MAKQFLRILAVTIAGLCLGCRTPWQPFGGSVSRDADDQTVLRVPENLPPLDPNASKPGESPNNAGPQFPDVKPQLTLAVKAPARTQKGSPARFAATVQNTGSTTARDVVVEVRFDGGLSFRNQTERMIRTTLKPLAAGASKTVEVRLDAKAVGVQRAEFTLTAGGREVVWKAVDVTVVPRRYDLSVIVPPLRTVGGRMELTITLSNVSSTDMKNVAVAVALDPKLLKPLEGSRGAKIDGGRVSWRMKTLKAGHGVQLQAECECVSVSRAACVMVEITADDAPTDSRLGCLQIAEMGKPFDMRIADTDDLLRVGGETEVIVSVQNRSGKRGTIPTLHVVMPAAFRLTSTSVWEAQTMLTVKTVVDKQTVTFAPVPIVDADDVLTYRLRVRALSAGHTSFRAALVRDGKTTLQLSEPMTVNAN